MPRYYLRRLGGAAKAARLAALSPTDHGTSLRGLGLLVRAFPGGDALLSASGRACARQVTGYDPIATRPVLDALDPARARRLTRLP
ncbi:hypothetical protein [Streptomyces vietnamensis]|uniref:hypothetical protein n=1 Tax=Streptomyces vietnamensis TaxID=362257 RepID=UPI00343148CB